MMKTMPLLLTLSLLATAPAHAISAKYRQQLEHSGCTQLSELQGCDIHKSKAENAKAGFVTDATPAAPQAAPAQGKARYQQQLERSGCTQASELQGCDISKSKAENAKAGFVTTTTAPAASSGSPYAGEWIATFPQTGATVAKIRIDAKDQVWVNGKQVKAKKSDGGLMFRDGMVSYFIQGDRRLQDQDYWTNTDAGTKGPIHAQ